MLPERLAAPPPGWSIETDVCVVGSGVAGLSVALAARQAGHRVAIVTKVQIDDGSTRYAQGGIAAVLDPSDTPEAHAADTHTAGAGLCDPHAVDVLVREGPARLHELMALGAMFDRHSDGSLALTREGGHHARRIVHAGGDATGAEVQRALVTAVELDEGIELIEHALVLDLLRDITGRAAGVTLHVLGEGRPDGVGAVLARAVVLATGGMGQVFDVTTNPTVSTGDGVALALRAGAHVADLEFMQFHPTALYAQAVDGKRALLTEALRGEGAYLRDHDGVRFMQKVHDLAELAPRDIVAKAITKRAQAQGSTHVFLDARHLATTFARRFPTVLALCKEAGIDPRSELVPVAPAAHYASGGILTDLYGRTTVPGLYACGEVACTGVHGANRLASNSLLEGLVFAARIGKDLRDLPPHTDPADDHRPTGLIANEARNTIAHTMTAEAGVLRNAHSLHNAAGTLAKLAANTTVQAHPTSWETTNLLTVATTLTHAAHIRRETRGCHWREDFPHSDPHWHTRTVCRLVEGELHTHPLPVNVANSLERTLSCH